MNKKTIKIILLVAVMVLLLAHFWKVFLPDQLEYTVHHYLEEEAYYEETAFKIYDTVKWLDGEVVAVEGEQMVGLVYLEKNFGVYAVRNHVLCNKTDTVKDAVMQGIDYQYRLLRAQAFVDNKDIVMAYVNDPEITLFEIENEANQRILQLPENRKLVFSESNQLHTIIKTKSTIQEDLLVEWKDKNFQDFIKYNTGRLVFKSDHPLNIAFVGTFDFKTDDSIFINKVSLEDIETLDVAAYDAVFINREITNDKLDELVKNHWDVCVVDPLDNINPIGIMNINEDVILIEKRLGGSGYSSKTDYYDSRSNYFMAYGYIFERLSERKE